MAYREGLSVLLYTYPAALCIVLFLSNLVGYGFSSAMYPRSYENRAGSGVLLRVTWHLQAVFSVALSANVVVTCVALKTAFQSGKGEGLLECYLASRLGVLFFNIAGILPDPNASYNPTLSSSFTWPSDSRNQQVLALICVAFLIVQRIINILTPYQLGVLVEALGKGRLPWKQLALYAFFRGLQGQQGVLGSIRAILWISISQSLYKRLTCAAFEHVLSLSLDFHISKRIGEVISALNKGGALNTFLDGFAFQLFPMVFDLWVAAIYLFVKFDAFYSLTVVGVLWSYIYITIYMAKYRAKARRRMADQDREMDATKTDAIMSYETVCYNGALAMETLKFNRVVGTFQNAEYAVLFSLNLLNVTQNLVFTFGMAIIICLSAYQISIGRQTVAMFVTLLSYFSQLQAPLAFFGSFYNQVQNNLVDAERMLALFHNTARTTDSPNARLLPECKGKITFSHVSFSHDPRKTSLNDVSFTVEPGTTTAIVGESGSGKSTCLQLLFRFYDVDGGSISVDESDVRDVTMESLRSQIGVVPQNSMLFNASLIQNLLYANPKASLSEIHEACRSAHIHERILEFPDRYDTVVGEGGARLSGGEKQRLTGSSLKIIIARAILRKPQIMLLDEATAALDSQTEAQVQRALETATAGRTTICIAHRLSTIVKSDQILVMHDGKIIERGTHNDLIQSRGKYSIMWEKQIQP
ncbi:ABC transporter aclQ [Physcia stellaris]|nr:ABC transporter aclQ [Physcia stellaris]